MLEYLKAIFQLILSPGRGWEDVARTNADPRHLASAGLYPMIGIAAVSQFAKAIWDPSISLVYLLELAIITFVMFFAGYFIGIFFMSIVMPELGAGSSSDKRVHTFVNYTIGMLAIISIINNVLPIDVPLVYFLPLYVAVIQWKGNRYMQVSDAFAGRLVLLSAPLVILPPYLIYAAFKYILP